MNLFSIIKIGKKCFDDGKYNEALEIFLKIFKKGIIQRDILYFIIFSYFQKWKHYDSVKFIKIFEKKFWFDRNIFLVKNLILWDFWKYNTIIKQYKNLEIWENEFEIILISNIYRNNWNYKKSLEVLKIWL